MLSTGELTDVAVALNCNSAGTLSNDTGMERIWFLSIRHTGTHYLFRHLERLGYAKGQIDWPMREVVKPTYRTNYFIHSHVEIRPSYEYKSNERCVVTVRNPVEVYLSHVYRYRAPVTDIMSHVVKSFKLLDELIGQHDAYVFRVDSQDQCQEVTNLADWLGVEVYKYKNISRRTHGARGNGNCRNPELFLAQPPEVIFALAESYGYT